MANTSFKLEHPLANQQIAYFIAGSQGAVDSIFSRLGIVGQAYEGVGFTILLERDPRSSLYCCCLEDGTTMFNVVYMD